MPMPYKLPTLNVVGLNACVPIEQLIMNLAWYLFIAPLQCRSAPHIPYSLHPIRTCHCQTKDWLRPIWNMLEVCV